jgi:hypothetical protein
VGVGGQKVIPRPSADSFAVGQRQKNNKHFCEKLKLFAKNDQEKTINF